MTASLLRRKEGDFPRPQVLEDECLQLVVELHNAKQSLDVRLAEALVAEGILGRDASGSFYTNAMVIQRSEGEELFALADQYSRPIENIVKNYLPVIKEKASSVVESFGEDFPRHSFFVLSDVLMDNWQIGHLEDLYLKRERPL